MRNYTKTPWKVEHRNNGTFIVAPGIGDIAEMISGSQAMRDANADFIVDAVKVRGERGDNNDARQ